MATQRYISTSFWSDKWIRSINPSDRYLYMYLMTNPLTNIAGVYQITIDRIAFDTGYDERTLRPMLDGFEDAGKAYFYNDEWIIIPKWPHHQQWSDRAKIRDGIISILQDLPEDVYEKLIEYGYHFDFSLVGKTIIARKVRQGISGTLRKAIIEKAGGVCSKCGDSSSELEIHHIIPLKDGGTNRSENLEAICRQCHIEIHRPHKINGYPHSINGLETASTVVHNYSDLDSDTDIDSNTDTDSDTPDVSPEDGSIPLHKRKPSEINLILRKSAKMSSLPTERRGVMEIPNYRDLIASLEKYSDEEIDEALSNYERIASQPEKYRISRYQSIIGFLANGGLAKFLTESNPEQLFAITPDRQSRADPGQFKTNFLTPEEQAQIDEELRRRRQGVKS